MIEFLKNLIFGKPKKVKRPLYQIQEEQKRIAARRKRKSKKNTRK